MSKARQQANLSSDGNLFADISNDRVGVGSVVPTHKLHVNGTSKFDDDVKFEGTTAALNIIWDKSANALKVSDGGLLQFGASTDLQIWHDTGSSHNYIRGTSSTRNHIQHGTHNAIITYPSAAVELYHNNSKKLETLSTGAKVTGNLEVTGVLTYDDVTSVDSVGIVTARGGIHIDDSIVHIGDTDTKIRFPAADTITAETGGSERLRIASDGKIGINNNSPNRTVNITSVTGGNCDVELKAANNTGWCQLIFSDTDAAFRGGIGYEHQNNYMAFYTGAQNERLRIDSSGRLLLGKTSGSFMLDLGAGSTDTLRITNTLESSHGSHDAKIVAGGSYYQNPNIVGSTIKFSTYNGSSEGERARITSGGSLIVGNQTSTSYKLCVSEAAHTRVEVISTNNNSAGAWFKVFNGGSITSQSTIRTSGGSLQVYTGTSSEAERLRIESNGDVEWNNVGTPTPGEGNNTVGMGFEPRNGTIFLSRGSNALIISNRNNDGRHIHFNQGGTGKFAIGLQNSGADLAFFSGAGNSPTERLRITSAGALNIGTGTESGNNANLVEMYVGATDESHATIRGKYNRTNDYNRSEVRFGVESNSAGKGFLAFATGNNSASERLRITSDGHMSLGGAAAPSSTNGGIGLKFGIKSSANNILIGETTSSSHNGLILESRLTGRSGGARTSQINIGQDGTGGHIVMSTAPGSAGVSERLRIDRNGDLGLGIAAVPQDSGAKTLHIHHPDTSGSTARAGLRLTTGISGSAASNGGFLGLDYSNNLYLYNQENGTLRIGTNGAEKLRIHNGGAYFYGNDNYFYGGTSGTNLNGDIKIRSTGTAVYQSLKFMSSDGSSQSQILGYGGGAILFRYANTHVWAINNQGERLELTNTALSPRSSSTVLDLGTSSKPYRNIYTNDLNLSNERMGSNDVDGTWGSYTIQEGENDLFLLNRRNGKKYKFNLTEVS